MLAASGRLNRTMFGPSFRPFTITVFNSNIYTPTDPIGPEFERRTIYRMNVLSGKSPLLESLDCPDPGVKIPAARPDDDPLAGSRDDERHVRPAPGEGPRRTSPPRSGRRPGEAGRSPLQAHPVAVADRRRDGPRPARWRRSTGWSEVAWMLLNASEFVYVE